MKALVYTEPRRVELRELDPPRPGAGEAIVRVAATGICGSDLHGFLGHSERRRPGLVLGHETVGVVAEVGADVAPSLLDARVSVNPLIACKRCAACAAGRPNVCADWRVLGMDTTPGAFAQYVRIPARNLLPLPAHVSDAAAVMIEPLANAVHLLSLAPAHAGMFPTAAIFGGGTLGIAILSVARARGMRVVAVSEPNARRGAVAERLGAERVLDPRSEDAVTEIRRLTGGQGVDLAIDAVGREETRRAAAASVTRGGTALLLGLESGATTLDFLDLIRREVRLQTSFTYTDGDYATALDMVARGAVDFTPWTDLLPLAEGQRAFERLVTDPQDRVKIALQP